MTEGSNWNLLKAAACVSVKSPDGERCGITFTMDGSALGVRLSIFQMNGLVADCARRIFAVHDGRPRKITLEGHVNAAVKFLQVTLSVFAIVRRFLASQTAGNTNSPFKGVGAVRKPTTG